MEEQRYKFYGTEKECLDYKNVITEMILNDGCVLLADIKGLFQVAINKQIDYNTLWRSADDIRVEPNPLDYNFVLSLPEPIFIEPDVCTEREPEREPDMVNHPAHYQSETGLEVFDVIEAFTFDLKGIEAYNTGNILKYMCRWKKKNGLEDLKKAQWYLNELINHVELLEEENK